MLQSKSNCCKRDSTLLRATSREFIELLSFGLRHIARSIKWAEGNKQQKSMVTPSNRRENLKKKLKNWSI